MRQDHPEQGEAPENIEDGDALAGTGCIRLGWKEVSGSE
jgi:hypothetical protein